ncbi:hypothetical protein R50073_09580 [Maricurvus nonylphenolicus]|uniref:glutathione S-transferase family protein n=1 Tax=Maricurvus nonylphenolicus TaxID=1008307 RepID=UPI0036F19EF1
MYKLYSIAGSCSTGIHVLLRKLHLPVEIVMRSDVDNYNQLVATNQVPALQTDDLLLTEGASIALYLLEKHSELPEDLQQRSEFRQWLMFNYATLHPAYSKLFAVNGAMADGEAKQALLQTLADRISELWRIVEQRLENRTYIVGDQPSLIDYLLAVYSRWGNSFPGLNIELGENTQRLIQTVMQLPEFIEAAEVEGIELAVAA